jgi:putative endonuclease
MMNKQYYVYILANKNNSVLYIGVTSNIHKRLFEHRNAVDKDSFSAKYGLKKLIYIEVYNNPLDAIKREKQIKKWNRKWKEELINEQNPGWIDLSEEYLKLEMGKRRFPIKLEMTFFYIYQEDSLRLPS